ncbi:YraN family protein [Sediminicurvatus halobius]|uniref:UPF0102 protein DEM34_02615 n=1 Tax=Sediminicurvatus halobius TaxID=2182432 RepID=A0A2U2N8F9_9GAMM|nr:YraN family protein [Spiribacter halobius]PWG65279.1 YraN family protein [Spiribacter halobius]UEX79968.1 YraN family protein [Spiribacter halobius]
MTPSTAARGEAAETRACAHLEARGLRCLARNFRTRRGEIDLVMADGRMLVFVEVRRRRRSRFGDGIDSISAAKRRRLAAAAAAYLQRRRDEPPCRFDVVAVDEHGGLEWLQNAFTLDD